MKNVLFRKLILFLTILASGGMLVFQREVVLFLILILCITIRNKVIVINKNSLPAIVIVFSVLIINVVFQPFSLDILIIRSSTFIVPIIIYNYYLGRTIEEFQNDLFSILKWFPFQAIVIVLLARFLPSLFTTEVLDNSTYQTILFVFTFHDEIDSSSILVRPDGFFFEPGVFQLYLNILLYLSLFIFRKKKYAILAILAIILTRSTTGIIISLLILLWYVIFDVKKKIKLDLKIIYTLVSISLLIPIYIVATLNIDDKFNGDNKNSSMARQYDVYTGINVALANPLIGIGFDYDEYIKIAKEVSYKGADLDLAYLQERTTTSGLALLYYSIGIPLGLIFTIAIFKQKFFKHNVLFGLILILSLLTEMLIYTPFFLIIIYSGFDNYFNKNKIIVNN